MDMAQRLQALRAAQSRRKAASPPTMAATGTASPPLATNSPTGVQTAPSTPPAIDGPPDGLLTQVRPSHPGATGVPDNACWKEISPGLWTSSTTIELDSWQAFQAAAWFPGWQNLVQTGIGAFDTETTGLSGGAGTIAFLAGHASWLDVEGFRGIEVVQYFMDDYPAEPAFLAALDQDLGAFRGLVSYNGASFDLPLLRTRAIMNGLLPGEYQHRDILHQARRHWKQLLGSASLGQVESSVLGWQRKEDIDSALIPEVYLSTLGSGQGAAHPSLGPVFAHHRQDMANLLVLSGLMDALSSNLVPTRLYPGAGFFTPDADFTKVEALPLGLRREVLSLAGQDLSAAYSVLCSGIDELRHQDSEARQLLRIKVRLARVLGREEERLHALGALHRHWNDPAATWSLASALLRRGGKDELARARDVLTRLVESSGSSALWKEKAIQRLGRIQD